MIEQTFSKHRRWLGNLKETLLIILNNDFGKMEIASRKQWTIQAMVNKIEERRKATKIREYRRLSKQLTELKSYMKRIFVT